jgi:hypothetical protein
MLAEYDDLPIAFADIDYLLYNPNPVAVRIVEDEQREHDISAECAIDRLVERGLLTIEKITVVSLTCAARGIVESEADET